jgi:hypothetical protein
MPSGKAYLQTPSLVDPSESEPSTFPSRHDAVNPVIEPSAAKKIPLPPPPGSFPDLPEAAPTVNLNPDLPDERSFPPPMRNGISHYPQSIFPLGDPPFSLEEGRQSPFSLRRLVSHLQNGLQNTNLRYYLTFFDEKVIRREFGASLCGFPSIFYAVATNDENILRTWVENGGDINAKEPRTGIPLLAFTILRT